MRIEKEKYLSEKNRELFKTLLSEKDLIDVAELTSSSIETVRSIRDRKRRVLSSNYRIVELMVKTAKKNIVETKIYYKKLDQQLKNIKLDVA